MQAQTSPAHALWRSGIPFRTFRASAKTKGSCVQVSAAPATHSGTWKKGQGKMSDLENPVPYQHTLCVKAVVSLQRSTMPHAKSDSLSLQRSVYSHATISFNSFTLYAVPMTPGCRNMVKFYVIRPNMSMCKSPNAGHTHLFFFFFLINVQFNKNEWFNPQTIKYKKQPQSRKVCPLPACSLYESSGLSAEVWMLQTHKDGNKTFLYHL